MICIVIQKHVINYGNKYTISERVEIRKVSLK